MMAGTKVGSLNNILGTRSRAIFPHRVNFDRVGYDTLPLMKAWCETHCKSIWRIEQIHAIYFQFEDDYDATMFLLKWATAEGNKLK